MTDHKDWKRMSFKGNKVWVPVDNSGQLVVENGKVLIKYNLDQDYEYRVRPDALKTADPENLVKKKEKKKKQTSSKPSSTGSPSIPFQPEEQNIIHVFTDGASSGNPGPSGIGVYLKYNEHEKKISKYIGNGTNNIAELMAIQIALEVIKNKALPVRLYTDSSYALGLLTKGWKPKKNKEIIEAILRLKQSFTDLSFIKVKGHAGIEGNEIADTLATSAIENR